MKRIEEILTGNRTVAILGHIHPDGDCIGSCLGLFQYIRKVNPGLQTDVYLESFREEFAFLKGAGQVRHDLATEQAYDLCIVCDASDRDRLGAGVGILDRAARTVSIDHHKTNTGFADLTHLRADTGSTCEILYELMDASLVDADIAACIYTGMVHDTGVFKYQSTTARTMEIAGKLMETGIPFTDIIDRTFYRRSHGQSLLMGQALLNSRLYVKGTLICSSLTWAEMERLGATPEDTDGIAEQLRLVDGVEVSLFLYETGPDTFKASMRSKRYVDVSRAAAQFGGGGHARAAGCTLHGSLPHAADGLLAYLTGELEQTAWTES